MRNVASVMAVINGMMEICAFLAIFLLGTSNVRVCQTGLVMVRVAITQDGRREGQPTEKKTHITRQ